MSHQQQTAETSSSSSARRVTEHGADRRRSKCTRHHTLSVLKYRATGSTLSQGAVQTDTFDDAHQPEAVPYSAVQFPLSKGPERWKKRPRSPGLKWYRAYDTPDSLKQGRVLVIDYVKQGR